VVTSEQIKQWLESGLDGARINVSGDGHHFEAIVIYDGFVDKTIIQQHRMVYDALGDKMKVQIHALSMKTYTPAQAKEANISI
jgi:acid stress-induced BolA-like protein IbaG/YrbA